MKRQRGRSRRSSGGGNNPNRHFESNGPDVKIRGSAQQVLDKYLQYARDAQTSGDRVMSEAYFQHAEHYQRLLAAMQPKEKPRRERDDSAEDSSEGDAAAAQAGEADPTEDTAPAPEGERKRSRRSPRREADAPSADADSASSDGLEVIDSADETAETVSIETNEEVDEAPPPPKPKRRRTYRKRDSAEAEAGSAEDSDGVMKTLARGHTPPTSAEAPEPSVDATEPSSGAAEAS